MTNVAVTLEIVATEFGSPDVLKAVPTKSRSPGRGEVTIQVRAVGVNHTDYKRYADPSYTVSSGHTPTFPLRLGVEAAGVVTAVGAQAMGPASPIVTGDEAIAYRITGAYADTIMLYAN
ncbi:alcohol dehydrogenase catalytic domain-containing protein [Nostoc sp.]|uniref:alcohol dehydrogenase catalytic domain-containing protein n=1 Tax=Nostoc sp. TaxID=1180 RepID=UPI002FF65224